MATFYIKADHFVLKDETVDTGYLAITDGLFGAWSEKAPDGEAEVIDRTGCWVVPGFVDAHIHGQAGWDVLSSDAAGLVTASEALAQAGTTTWTPTITSAPTEQISATCARVYEASRMRDDSSAAARIQGIFLEGPFLSEAYAGAQDPACLIDPDPDLFRCWQEQAHGLICRSALAPEREGSLRYINELINTGVATALGHSAATFDEAVCGVGAGASSFVHTFHAMTPLDHHEPGMVGCAMATPAIAELVADDEQLAYGAAAALVYAKGWDHVALVTNCHAGETVTMLDAMRTLYGWGITSLGEAVRMASEVPARMSLIDDVCGCIAPGRNADLNVLGRGLTLEETYIGGRLVER